MAPPIAPRPQAGPSKTNSKPNLARTEKTSTIDLTTAEQDLTQVHVPHQVRVFLRSLNGGLDRKIMLDATSKAFDFGRASHHSERGTKVAASNALVESPIVSRLHCKLYADLGRQRAVYVEDLGSTHGTFLNEKKVREGVATRVHTGDRIRLGIPVINGPRTYTPKSFEIRLHWADRSDSKLYTEPRFHQSSRPKLPPSIPTPADSPKEKALVKTFSVPNVSDSEMDDAAGCASKKPTTQADRPEIISSGKADMPAVVFVDESPAIAVPENTGAAAVDASSHAKGQDSNPREETSSPPDQRLSRAGCVADLGYRSDIEVDDFGCIADSLLAEEGDAAAHHSTPLDLVEDLPCSSHRPDEPLEDERSGVSPDYSPAYDNNFLAADGLREKEDLSQHLDADDLSSERSYASHIPSEDELLAETEDRINLNCNSQQLYGDDVEEAEDQQYDYPSLQSRSESDLSVPSVAGSIPDRLPDNLPAGDSDNASAMSISSGEPSDDEDEDYVSDVIPDTMAETMSRLCKTTEASKPGESFLEHVPLKSAAEPLQSGTEPRSEEASKAKPARSDVAPVSRDLARVRKAYLDDTWPSEVPRPRDGLPNPSGSETPDKSSFNTYLTNYSPYPQYADGPFATLSDRMHATIPMLDSASTRDWVGPLTSLEAPHPNLPPASPTGPVLPRPTRVSIYDLMNGSRDASPQANGEMMSVDTSRAIRGDPSEVDQQDYVDDLYRAVDTNPKSYVMDSFPDAQPRSGLIGPPTLLSDASQTVQYQRAYSLNDEQRRKGLVEQLTAQALPAHIRISEHCTAETTNGPVIPPGEGGQLRVLPAGQMEIEPDVQGTTNHANLMRAHEEASKLMSDELDREENIGSRDENVESEGEAESEYEPQMDLVSEPKVQETKFDREGKGKDFGNGKAREADQSDPAASQPAPIMKVSESDRYEWFCESHWDDWNDMAVSWTGKRGLVMTTNGSEDEPLQKKRRMTPSENRARETRELEQMPEPGESREPEKRQDPAAATKPDSSDERVAFIFPESKFPELNDFSDSDASYETDWDVNAPWSAPSDEEYKSDDEDPSEDEAGWDDASLELEALDLLLRDKAFKEWGGVDRDRRHLLGEWRQRLGVKYQWTRSDLQEITAIQAAIQLQPCERAAYMQAANDEPREDLLPVNEWRERITVVDLTCPSPQSSGLSESQPGTRAPVIIDLTSATPNMSQARPGALRASTEASESFDDFMAHMNAPNRASPTAALDSNKAVDTPQASTAAQVANMIHKRRREENHRRRRPAWRSFLTGAIAGAATVLGTAAMLLATVPDEVREEAMREW